MSRKVLITWEYQRRNKGLSDGLGFKLYEVVYKGNSYLRYFYCFFKTVVILIRNRPKNLIVQNPSIVLSFLSVFLKPIFNYYLIVDFHNAGLFPLESKSGVLFKLSCYIQKKADLCIVTNDGMGQVISNNGGVPFVLPDKLPTINKIGEFKFCEGLRIVFICTYSNDEPYLSVFEAAINLPEDHIIYVTGKYKGKIQGSNVPSNVKLLGFIPDDEYWGLLKDADIIMDLTIRDDCLVCGAYEGVAVGKPLILSNTYALRNYFRLGSVYVDPNSSSIKDGIVQCVAKYESLKKEVSLMKAELNKDWNSRANRLIKMLE